MAQLRGMGYRTAAMALKEDSLSPDARVLHEAEKLAIILGTEGEAWQRTLSQTVITRSASLWQEVWIP